MTKEDHFSYRDHNFWTKIRSCENRFSTTVDFQFFTVFIRDSFTGPNRALCERHFHPNRSKKVFFGFRFFSAEGVGGSNQHYKKVRLDPKDIPNRWYVHRNDIAEISTGHQDYELNENKVSP